MREISNLVYTTSGAPQHLDLYVPKGPVPQGGWPVILAIPGGGWRWVRRSDLGNRVGALAKNGYVVAVVDYAFASSTPGTSVWPNNLDDIRQAIHWLRTTGQRFGVDPSRVAVWGESAGGHLAALLATDPGPPNGGVSNQVQAVVDFYGPTDLNLLYQESAKARPYLQTFLGGTPSTVPQRYADASPVTHVNGQSPPFLIYQGTADTTVPADQAAQLDQALSAAHVPHMVHWVVGGTHGFSYNLGKGITVLPEILTFLDEALNHHSAGIPA